MGCLKQFKRSATLAIARRRRRHWCAVYSLSFAQPLPVAARHTQTRRLTIRRESKRAPVSLPGLQGGFLMLKSRGSLPWTVHAIPKRKSDKEYSKKCKSLSKKCKSNHPSALLRLKQETNGRPGASKHKESSHGKVRSMPWKAGIRHPLP